MGILGWFWGVSTGQERINQMLICFIPVGNRMGQNYGGFLEKSSQRQKLSKRNFVALPLAYSDKRNFLKLATNDQAVLFTPRNMWSTYPSHRAVIKLRTIGKINIKMIAFGNKEHTMD